MTKVSKAKPKRRKLVGLTTIYENKNKNKNERQCKRNSYRLAPKDIDKTWKEKERSI